MGLRQWAELGEVRARLAAGADPNGDAMGGTALHTAAEWGSAAVVAELARLVDDVDAERDGRTALWVAVQAGLGDNARALVAAGADPWRPMMAGWSPGRLALAGRTPDLFGPPPQSAALSETETAAAQEAHRLIDALGTFYYEGLSLAAASGIDAVEAVRRLEGTPVELAVVREAWEDPVDEDAVLTVGVTSVPGGCVVSQPWAYGASMPGIARRLSVGGVCAAMYANPKSGNQGRTYRDGVVEGWDLHPGGGCCGADEPAEAILHTYLYRGKAIASCCAVAGLRLADARAFTGKPDVWVRVPSRDYWAPNG